MTRLTVHEYAAGLRPRYRTATKGVKKRILDEFCETTGMHRKAAIRLLGRAARPACPAGGPAPSRGEPITLGFISKRLMQHALYHGAQIDYIRTMGEEGWGRGRTYWEEAVDAVSECQ